MKLFNIKKIGYIYILIIAIIFLNNSLESFEIENNSQIKNQNIKSETLTLTDTSIYLSVNWFNYDKNSENLILSNKVQDILKNEIENKIKYSTEIKLSINADVKITGYINELKIVDERKNQNNEVIEKRIKILFEWKLENVYNNNIITVRKNIFEEYTFKTKLYSEEIGLTEKEAVENFLKSAAIKLYDDLSEVISTEKKNILQDRIKFSIIKKKKKEAESSKSDTIVKSPETQFKVSGRVTFEDENIKVAGNVTASGETKDNINKITSKQNIDFYANLASTKISGTFSTRINDYDYKKNEIDKIYLEYAQKKFTLAAGNIFTNFSKIMFNNSFEGLFADIKFNNLISMKALAGREKTPHNNINFERFNYGLNFNINFSKDASLSVNSVYSNDDKNSIVYDTTALIPLRNLLTSIKGLYRYESLKFDYEIIKSMTKNLDTKKNDDDKALLFNINYRTVKQIAALGYSYIGPDFYTANGLATIDREKIFGNYNAKFISNLPIFCSFNLQRDNLNKNNDLTNYLIEEKISADYSPFKKGTNQLSKNILVQNTFNYRKNYNKETNQKPKDKDTINNIYRLNITNSLFKNAYRILLAFEKEKEKDDIQLIDNSIKTFEFGNNYQKKIIEPLELNAAAKFRYKENNDITDKMLNSSITLNYKKENFDSIFEYYIDSTLSSLEGSDMITQKFKLSNEFTLTPVSEKDKRRVILKLDFGYEINRFELSENNFDKFTVTSGMIINF